MKDFIKAMDNLPWILKVILCIPALEIVWGVYRVCRSLVKKNTLALIIAILLIVPGAAFMWVIDIICVILTGKIWWIC